MRSKMHDIKERCEEKSKDLVAGFIGLFGKEGKIVSTESCDHTLYTLSFPNTE